MFWFLKSRIMGGDKWTQYVTGTGIILWSFDQPASRRTQRAMNQKTGKCYTNFSPLVMLDKIICEHLYELLLISIACHVMTCTIILPPEYFILQLATNIHPWFARTTSDLYKSGCNWRTIGSHSNTEYIYIVKFTDSRDGFIYQILIILCFLIVC